MNGKQHFLLLLALLLIISAVPALAAPTRSEEALDVTVENRLQALVDIVCKAIPEDCFGMEARTVLEKEQAPGAAFTAQALWAAVRKTRETTLLSHEEAAELYRQLFTCGAYDPAALDGAPFVKVLEDGLEIVPAVSDTACSGAFIYAAAFDGTDVLVKCDLYYTEAEGEDIFEAPDILLTWTNHAVLSLRFAPETDFGWTVNSISLSPCYRDGNMGDWWEAENGALEYSVNVPGSLNLTDGTPEHWVFTNIEGDVSLTIEAKEDNQSYEQALAAFMQAHPGQKVTQERLYDAFTLLEAGRFTMVVTADEYPITYTVTLTFPADRQDEYAFYANIIRNSFGVRGLSNG